MRVFPRGASREKGETLVSRLFGRLASHWSRVRTDWLAAGATVVMTAVLAIWVIPWVPVGMTGDNYSFAVWVALVLTMATAVMALLAFVARERAGGDGALQDVWRGLFSKRVTLRNRHQFHNRVARECRRVQRDRRLSLSLLLVRVRQRDGRTDPGSPDALEHVARALAATMRTTDVIGVARDDEIGVLAIGADVKAREVVRARFERALAAAFTDRTGDGLSSGTPVVSLGVSTFGPDDDPDSLVAAARASLAPVIRGRKKAHRTSARAA